MSFGGVLRLTAAGCFLFASSLFAQADAGLAGVDLSGLSPAQVAAVKKLAAEHDCSCQCGMKISECRVKDPACGYSKGLANAAAAALRKGGTEDEAWKAAAASPFAKGPTPQQQTSILSDPVPIPVNGAPVLGPASAPVTIVEFSDFQCPYCVAAVPEIKALLKAYPTQVKLIFKQFPLDNHSHAAYAAGAALAAQRQGKFWEMHDALFAGHNDLSREHIAVIARQIGLNVKQFEADVLSPAVLDVVRRDIGDGDTAGVQGTPTIFINGQRYNGPIEMQALQPLLDAQLKSAAPATASLKQ